jgi:hypothetical protein
MQAIISEEEQAHIYSCLLVGNNEFAKIKKSLAKLNREDQKVDDEIAINADLRRKFNPRAEEEARERERAKHEAGQLDLEDQIQSETGGRTRLRKAVDGDQQNTESDTGATDEALRDGLLLRDRLVLMSDIRGWNAEERAAAIAWANNDLWEEAIEPDCVERVAITQERCDALTKAGPYTCRSIPEGADEAEMVVVLIPGGIVNGEPNEDEVDSQYTDGVEAEIKCARLNRTHMRLGDMPVDQVGRWLAAGPWSIQGQLERQEGQDAAYVADRWYVVDVANEERELAEGEEDARFTAARYNRNLAGREADGSWKEPPPPRVSGEEVEAIKAAVEAE